MLHMSRLVCLGLSHQTASVELRESVSGPTLVGERPAAVEELVLISTCNRVELYACLSEEVEDGWTLLRDLLADAHGIAASLLDDHLYYLTGQAAMEHLCRVAAGLESLVLGEPQILGQIGDAFQQAQQEKQVGQVLTTAFRIAIGVGKRARTETAISTNPASISSVAIALAQSVAGTFRHQRILVVGYGEMGRLTVKTLRSRGVSQIDLANRTVEKAAAAVGQWGGRAYDLADLATALSETDIVFTAASPATPLNDRAMVGGVVGGGGRTPLLGEPGLPPHVGGGGGDLPHVRLFDVDDLRSSLDEALTARQREVPRVDAIIAEELDVWRRHVQELTIRPLILDLRQHAETIRQRELARTLRFLGEVDPQIVAHVQQFSQALVNQLLHEPTTRLKEHAAADDASDYASTVRELFGLAR